MKASPLSRPSTLTAVAAASASIPHFAMTVTRMSDVNPAPVFGSMMCEYRFPAASRCCSELPEVETAA
jgi:hypothetical protein